MAAKRVWSIPGSYGGGTAAIAILKRIEPGSLPAHGPPSVFDLGSNCSLKKT